MRDAGGRGGRSRWRIWMVIPPTSVKTSATWLLCAGAATAGMITHCGPNDAGRPVRHARTAAARY